MIANLESCKTTFKIGFEAFEQSRKEAKEVWDLFHNRQYTDEQLSILAGRGQPAETFNVIKMFARLLVGYYSTVVNTAVVRPNHPRDITTATVLNDAVNYVFRQNKFDSEGDRVKLGGILSGLMCTYVDVKDSGKRDQFGRPINNVSLSHVPDSELILDPSSSKEDYSDARFIHRYRWFTEDEVKELFGKDAVSKLTAFYNYTENPDADFKHNFGAIRLVDQFLIVHTVIVDGDGRRWSIYWHGDVELFKEEITFKEAIWPYRVQKLHSSDEAEYYGVFREIIESQKAINQAVIQIQLMINTDKVLVEENAVEDIESFRTSYGRVNGIIPVLNINGIKVENLSSEIAQQYVIIDRALDRIQRVLGINDSFLGMAYASDSGKKVKLQQGATIMSLRYLTVRIEAFYSSLATDVANLVKQYFRAHQFLRLTDSMSGQRWVELNKPMEMFSGSFDAQGQPIFEPILLEVLDPASNEPLEDEEGNILLAPVSEEGTDFTFTDFEVTIESSAFNDEDEKSQLMIDSVMSGGIGQMLMQANPSGFFQVASLAIKTISTKHSPQIAAILEETATMLQPPQPMPTDGEQL